VFLILLEFLFFSFCFLEIGTGLGFSPHVHSSRPELFPPYFFSLCGLLVSARMQAGRLLLISLMSSDGDFSTMCFLALLIIDPRD